MHGKEVTLIFAQIFLLIFPVSTMGIDYRTFRKIFVSNNDFDEKGNVSHLTSKIQCGSITLSNGFLAFHFNVTSSECIFGHVNEGRGHERHYQNDMDVYIAGNISIKAQEDDGNLMAILTIGYEPNVTHSPPYDLILPNGSLCKIPLINDYLPINPLTDRAQLAYDNGAIYLCSGETLNTECQFLDMNGGHAKWEILPKSNITENYGKKGGMVVVNGNLIRLGKNKK